MYILINKSQLNHDISSEVNFQKMQIPLFMFYSTISCDRHTNSKLTILWNLGEGCIGIFDIPF